MPELTPPGEICRAWQPGAYLIDSDPACGHLWMLHSDRRGCAACEAIAEVIKAARLASHRGPPYA
jgi:hypothetical protein